MKVSSSTPNATDAEFGQEDQREHTQDGEGGRQHHHRRRSEVMITPAGDR
jgi:hypothetical protein